MIADVKKDAEHRMQRSIEALKEELRRLRTGRAHTGLLDHITVEYYGSEVPISQTATVTVDAGVLPDPSDVRRVLARRRQRVRDVRDLDARC